VSVDMALYLQNPAKVANVNIWSIFGLHKWQELLYTIACALLADVPLTEAHMVSGQRWHLQKLRSRKEVYMYLIGLAPFL
jgi:hypothetical protein